MSLPIQPPTKEPHRPHEHVRDPRVMELLADVPDQFKAELLADMIETVVRLGKDDAFVADLKLYKRALAELRYAGKIFSYYHDIRKVAVFGSARTKPNAPEYKMACEFAEKMVQRGFMIITGGGDGIMGAAQEGAGAEKSFGLNIRLPFEQHANPVIQGDRKLINFNYFFTRKLHFIKETHAFVMLPGGFGTHDEGFECLTLMQTGKSQIRPIIFLDKVNGYYWETWRRFLDNDLLEAGLISPTDFHLFRIVHSADEAVQEITKFYSIFHSYRWVKTQMVIRIQKKLTAKAIDALNERFRDLLAEGHVVQQQALPEEHDEAHLAELPRLVLTPNKRDFGLLRLFLDAVNDSETV